MFYSRRGPWGSAASRFWTEPGNEPTVRARRARAGAPLPPHTALRPAEPSSRSHHAAAFATPLDTVPKGHRTALEGVELVLGGREGAEKKKTLSLFIDKAHICA